jgi:23S rRNA (uracil1939-C5)-methyltransferase
VAAPASAETATEPRAGAKPTAGLPTAGLSTVRLTITGLAVGGDGVGRAPDGRVVFVPGGVPGDTVDARLVDQRKRFARASLLSVAAPGPDRIEPGCPMVGRGCGGCGWQHLALAAQREGKRQLVADALTRLGGVRDLDVTAGPVLPADGFRTTLRCAVRGDRAALRRSRSHDLVRVEHCPVAHPLLGELLADGRFPGAAEVTLRCGARTGERLVLVRPRVAGRPVVAEVPGDVVVAGPDRPGAYHEEVAGQRWRISAQSFFQSRADGAELLVQRVRELLDPAPARLLDAYGGVGLLAAAAPDAEVISVEAEPHASADARVNLGRRAATVVASPVERWEPVLVDAVVADPARGGLERAGAEVLAATGAATIVLVSCDAGALGRDAGLLVERGYQPDHCEVLDLFPHTPHVEVVTRFRRR